MRAIDPPVFMSLRLKAVKVAWTTAAGPSCAGAGAAAARLAALTEIRTAPERRNIIEVK
ncbi:MAG: hypothetical protein ACRED9_07125 [Caulobacteraceae bacterium]